MNAGVILFLIFAVCVLIGVPISMSLGIGSLAAVALGNLGVSPAVIAQRVFGGLQSTSIMAIAFFILAGNLMAGGGISRRIVNFANCLIGNIRGGMSVALVIACAFFAALSGSAPATVVAIGSMLYADMVKQGYPEDRTAGLLVIAGGLGPVIPPSIIMVLYCTLTGASVTNMFSQGMVIGVLIMIVLILEALYYAHKEKWPKAETKHTAGEIGKIFLEAVPALMTPVIILGGIYSGLLTATESAAVACVWAFIAGVFIYKEIKIADLIPLCMSDNAWNKIPDDMKDTFVEAVWAGCEKQWQYLNEANDEAIGLLEGVGVTMYDIDTDELKAAYEAKKSASGVTYDETWQAAVDAAKAAQA